MRLRNRTLKAEYWGDRKLRPLTDTARLVYAGLWQVCDDAGYGVWLADEIAAALFPYQDPVLREPKVIGAMVELRECGAVKLLRCGHFTIPSLPKHVYSSKANRTSGVMREHEAGHCPKPPRQPASPRGMTRHDEAARGMTRADGQVRYGTDRIGSDNARPGAKPSNGTAAASEAELRRLIEADDTSPAVEKAARKALERMGVTL